MNWVNWVIIAVIVAVVIGFVVYYAVKLSKMSTEEKRSLIVTYLIGFCDLAEQQFVGTKRGQEKIAWVEEQFNAHAGWFLKLVFKFTKTNSLQELIELALKTAKETKWDQK